MLTKKDLAIIIPYYKPYISLTDDEIKSINQCFKILTSYQVYFVGPNNVDASPYVNAYTKDGATVDAIQFDDAYFKNVAGYNKLMLSVEFYKTFNNYKYILVYQADAWIFRDDLLQWCNKNYDYVGAPWIDWKWSTFAAKNITIPRAILSKLGYNKFNLVGNGGFSLRKVNTFIFNLRLFRSFASSFKDNEDYFFAFFVTTYNPFFKIPQVKDALDFCFDENPEKSYLLNNSVLPMACHAWPRYNTFWKEFIQLK